MRRTFTIQLYDGGNRHKHTCELCGDQWHCGETKCPGPDTMDGCDACISRFDCPQCGTDVRDTLEWQCDTQTDHGLIVQFSARCPNCDTGICYKDNDDGRGALRIVWKPSDITAGRCAERAPDVVLE